MRSKRGERERRAERKGGRTGSWWAAPSLPFVRVGVGVALLSLFAMVGVGVALSSSSVFVLRGPCSLLSIAHRRPSFVRVRRALLRGSASLALRLTLGEVEGCWPSTIVRGRRWWCRVSRVRASGRGPWWSCVGFVGAGRRLGLLCASRVFVAVVGCRVVVVLGRLGSCHQVVFMWRCMGSTWWRSGRGLSLAVCRGCGRRRWRGGC